MNKYQLFDYEPSSIIGEDLADALMRQREIKTPKRYRRIDLGYTDPVTGRYAFEQHGGDVLEIKRVIEITSNPDATRGNKNYETAVCELTNGKIVEIDASLDYRGRPPIYGEKMRQTAVWLPEEQISWLKSQGNLSEKLRELIAAAMNDNSD